MDLREIVTELGRSTDTFGRFIQQQADRIPDRTALKFEDASLTYGAYDREGDRRAAALARAGLGAGEACAILVPNSPLFLVALGAVAKLGAIGALVNTHVTGAGLTHVLQESRARLGICDGARVGPLAEVAGSHSVAFLADVAGGIALPPGVTPLDDLRRAAPPAPDIPDVRGRDVFLYIYTSGTTGYPKPAIVRHLRFTMGGIGL